MKRSQWIANLVNQAVDGLLYAVDRLLRLVRRGKPDREEE